MQDVNTGLQLPAVLRLAAPRKTFRGQKHLALEVWLRGVRSMVENAWRTCTSRWRARGQRHRQEHLALTTLALRIYRDSPWVAVQNDKEPGYTLHDRATLTQLKLGIMQSEACLDREDFCDLQHMRSQVRDRAAWIAKRQRNHGL